MTDDVHGRGEEFVLRCVIVAKSMSLRLLRLTYREVRGVHILQDINFIINLDDRINDKILRKDCLFLY